MYLIDNNVISEMRKIRTQKANINVIKWVNLVHPQDFYTSLIIIMEIKRGVLIKQRKDPYQANILQRWLDYVETTLFKDKILSLDRQISDICAALHVPNPRSENDCWIASTAIANDLILVTRNVSDFVGMPVKILNPFDDIA